MRWSCPAEHDVDAEELIGFCRERIAGYKVPKTIDIRHEPLPKSGRASAEARVARAVLGGPPGAHRRR